jgi:hypothetical protein
MGSINHSIGSFGDNTETIRNRLRGRCDELTERTLSLLLSVAKRDQTQLECDGFLYRRRRRFVELMFSDDRLDIVHIMRTEPDHEELRELLRQAYGEPSFRSDQAIYYPSQGISLRTQPFEISFVSERVREEYGHYIRSLGSTSTLA